MVLIPSLTSGKGVQFELEDSLFLGKEQTIKHATSVWIGSKCTEDTTWSVSRFGSKYFNPRLRLGIGPAHASLLFPNLGVKFGRLDLSMSLGMDTWGNGAIATNIELDAIKLKQKPNRYVSFSFSAGYIYWDGYVAFQAGVTKYTNKRSIKFKTGIGFYEVPFPVVGFGYSFYAFQT